MDNDRKTLIRLASRMPVGDPSRKVILAELQKRGALMWWWHEKAIKDALDGEAYGLPVFEDEKGRHTYRNFFKAIHKSERRRLPKQERQWLQAMADLIVSQQGAEGSMSVVPERKVKGELQDFIGELHEQGFMAYDEPENALNEPLTDAGLDELVLLAIAEINKL